MQLVHLACVHNALFNIIHYLSSLFPASLITRNSKGYTLFMLTLWDKLDKDIIRLLSLLGDLAKMAIVNKFFGDKFFTVIPK
jgi:hypothetical protein